MIISDLNHKERTTEQKQVVGAGYYYYPNYAVGIAFARADVVAPYAVSITSARSGAAPGVGSFSESSAVAEGWG